MGEAARLSTDRSTSGHPGGSCAYVIVRQEDDSEKVLCILPASGEKTLPAFASRETARRFLCFGSLRFGLLESRWRVRKLTSGELASLFSVGPRAGVRRIALNPSPEALLGGYTAEAAGLAV